MAPFRVFARPGCDLAMGGRVDAADAAPFGAAVSRALPVVEAQRPVIDASETGLISHQGVPALAPLGPPIVTKRPPGPWGGSSIS